MARSTGKRRGEISEGSMKMRTVVGLILSFLAAAGSAKAQRDQDEQAIRKVMSDFVDDVNRHDSVAFGKLLAADAEFVVITGEYLKGRSEVERYHARIWATSKNFKDSHLTWTPLNVRFLDTDVAVAHVSAERFYSDTKDKRTMLVTLVLAKEGGRWLVTALQNTWVSGRLLSSGN
jgi:uncharacterized protein (TIGR02246 family)